MKRMANLPGNGSDAYAISPRYCPPVVWRRATWIDSPHPRLAHRAIRCANVRSGLTAMDGGMPKMQEYFSACLRSPLAREWRLFVTCLDDAHAVACDGVEWNRALL
jgi:hypothetical protein